MYSYDDSFSVAERFCKLKNLQFNWPQFRAIAMLIETKINNTAQSLEAMIANRENQSDPFFLCFKNKCLGFEDPNMSRSFGSQKIKETRAGGHSSIRNVQSVYNEEIYIGKVYVELDNKKVFFSYKITLNFF